MKVRREIDWWGMFTEYTTRVTKDKYFKRLSGDWGKSVTIL